MPEVGYIVWLLCLIVFDSSRSGFHQSTMGQVYLVTESDRSVSRNAFCRVGEHAIAAFPSTIAQPTDLFELGSLSYVLMDRNKTSAQKQTRNNLSQIGTQPKVL